MALLLQIMLGVGLTDLFAFLLVLVSLGRLVHFGDMVLSFVHLADS